MTMQRSKPMKRNITKDTTVYSASAWWQDSDPSMQVVGTSKEQVKKKMFRMMKDSARNEAESGMYDSVGDALSDIHWSGIHSFRLGDLASDRELEYAISDIQDSGVWYPDR